MACSVTRGFTVVLPWPSEMLILFAFLLFHFIFRQELPEAVQATLPKDPTPRDPSLGRSQAIWMDTARTHTPHFLARYDSAFLEHLEMLDHRGQRHGEGRRELTHRSRPRREALYHGPSCGIGERVEHPIERCLMVKHLLNHTRPDLIVNRSLKLRDTTTGYSSRDSAQAGSYISFDDLGDQWAVDEHVTSVIHQVTGTPPRRFGAF